MINGDRLVIVGAVGTMGIEGLKMALVEEQWNSRVVVGGAITFTVLAGLGEVAPAPAGMFAMLILLTVAIADGGLVINRLMGNATAASPDPAAKIPGTSNAAYQARAKVLANQAKNNDASFLNPLNKGSK